MKGSVDRQIDLGLADPTSFGLLVEGFKCALYMMTIKEEGIYVPVLVKKFTLPEEIEDAINIPSVVESLFFVKDGLSTFKAKFETRQRNKPLQAFKKASFVTKSE